MTEGAPSEAPRTGPRTSLAWDVAPGTLLAGMAGGLVFPILPIVAMEHGLSLPFIGVILAANRAVRVVSSPFVGSFADRFGARRMLLFGLAVQTVVLALFGLGDVTGIVGPFFLAGRLLHGLSSASVFIAAQALALHAGGAAQGGRAAGTVRASIVLGVPIGLAAGGLLSEAIGDAMTFAVAGCAVLVALVVASVRVPDLRSPFERDTSFRETLRAMRDRRLVAIGVLNMILNFAFGGMILATIALLVHARDLSVLGRNEQGTAGLLMALAITVDAATTPLAGRIGDRWRAHARVATVAMLLVVAGLAVVGSSAHVGGVAAGLVLIGLGAAGLGPSLLVLMGALVPRERRGTAVGLLQLCGDAGGVLGPIVGTALLPHDVGIPYIATAGVVACFVPLAAWLARVEARGPDSAQK